MSLRCQSMKKPMFSTLKSTGSDRSATISVNAIRPDAVGEGVELLALLALVLVELQPPLDGLRHALGGQARLQPGGVDDLAALVVAAHVRDVGRDGLVADLDRGSVEADVGDVVLAAAVRAARVLDVDPLGQRVRDVQLLELGVDGAVQPHRAGDAQLAAVGAGAGDGVQDLAGAVLAEAQLGQLLPHLVDRLVAHPAQHEVLLDRGAGPAAAVGRAGSRRWRASARATGRRGTRARRSWRSRPGAGAARSRP